MAGTSLDKPGHDVERIWRYSNFSRTSRLAKTLRRLCLRIPYCAPDALGRQRHVDMRDAVFGERIEYRVDDGGEAAGAAGFAAAFGAQRIGFGRHRMIADRHDRNVFCAWQRIVHERPRDRLAV